MDTDNPKNNENSLLRKAGWLLFTIFTLIFNLPTLRTSLENRPNGIAMTASTAFIVA